MTWGNTLALGVNLNSRSGGSCTDSSESLALPLHYLIFVHVRRNQVPIVVPIPHNAVGSLRRTYPIINVAITTPLNG
jgi:hypothetical protein